MCVYVSVCHNDSLYNCILYITGTRVAVLVDRVEGSLKVRHNDARLFMFDRQKGMY